MLLLLVVVVVVGVVVVAVVVVVVVVVVAAVVVAVVVVVVVVVAIAVALVVYIIHPQFQIFTIIICLTLFNFLNILFSGGIHFIYYFISIQMKTLSSTPLIHHRRCLATEDKFSRADLWRPFASLPRGTYGTFRVIRTMPKIFTAAMSKEVHDCDPALGTPDR